MAQGDMEIWERIEARLSSVQWSKPKSTPRLASYDSAHEPDAWDALCRNAAAAERDKPEPPSIRRRPGLALPHISEEVRAEHDYAFKEREGFYLDAGLIPRCPSREINPRCCAYHAALSEVGCLEFFDHASALPYVRGMVHASRPAVEHVFCARCESVSHEVESCPFGVGDADVMNAARLRRERRAAAVEPRRKVV
ncbi:MAG TPA: hypothetical protein VF521_09620 [Pyrinomonadaceae bacterium]|jgi:hypothetical protein